jgi:hypothetical protein
MPRRRAETDDSEDRRYPAGVIRAALIAGALALLVTASVVAAPSPNVRGVVIGSQVFTCPRDEPCDPPLNAVFVVFTRQSGTTTRARVSDAGTFGLRLAPGLYSVRLAPAQLGKVTPTSVRVPRKGVLRVRLALR